MIDLSAVVAYLTTVSVVGAVVYLITLSRRHPALSRPWESRASIDGGNIEKTQPIRLVIADDHPIFREWLRRLLEAETDLKVVGEASDGAEAVKLVRQLKPDILLLDLAMPKYPVWEALRELSSPASATPVRVILLAVAIEKSQIVEALQLGVRGVVLKDSGTQVLLKAIHTVMAGEYWMDRESFSNLVQGYLRTLAQCLPTASDSNDEGERPQNEGIRLTKQFELFAELAPAEFEVIVNAGREKRFCRGERIFTEGDPVDHVTMLLSGFVKVTRMELNGSEVILELRGAGEIPGSFPDRAGRKQRSRAQAVLPSDALVWDAGVFQKLLARIPTFRRNLMRALKKHLSEMAQRYQEVSSQEVSSRLRSVLVRIANRLPRSTESRLEIPLSRSELAQLTGTTLFTVSRLLCQWQSQGIVTVREQGLEIITLEKLREQGAVTQQDDESWVLPTAALASSISFTTGLFTTGTITRVVNGGLTRPSFSVTVVGSLETFVVSTTNLSTGSNVPGLGMGRFSSGMLTVRDSVTGAVLFTDTLSMGVIIKADTLANISAVLAPNAVFPTGGSLLMNVSYSNAPITNDLIGGIGVAVSTTPHPPVLSPSAPSIRPSDGAESPPMLAQPMKAKRVSRIVS